MSKYTATDFANARFAEHEDGRRAVRTSTPVAPWIMEMRNGPGHCAKDSEMARDGWVPAPTKPTITESQFLPIASRLFKRWPDLGVFMSNLQCELSRLGIEVIPDPEPTDEELLAGIIRNIDDWQSITSPELLAKYLNTAGVTVDKENK